MARRKELNNIASGLFGSFISRNNDVGGYWGIGKLCLLAQQHETSTVRLDLLAKSVVPESPEFVKLVAGYCTFLQRHLAARGIPTNWVSSATIDVNFKPEPLSKKHIPMVTWGNLFKLTVTITDDRNKNHEAKGYSYCGPRNPQKELKSAGSERF
jgi:hypothetical protein